MYDRFVAVCSYLRTTPEIVYGRPGWMILEQPWITTRLDRFCGLMRTKRRREYITGPSYKSVGHTRVLGCALSPCKTAPMFREQTDGKLGWIMLAE